MSAGGVTKQYSKWRREVRNITVSIWYCFFIL